MLRLAFGGRVGALQIGHAEPRCAHRRLQARVVQQRDAHCRVGCEWLVQQSGYRGAAVHGGMGQWHIVALQADDLATQLRL